VTIKPGFTGKDAVSDICPFFSQEIIFVKIRDEND
jgi:hypothetical protein